MHGDESNLGLLLHQRLRAVAVVHVPVDDEHATDFVPRARVVRADRHRAEETESHPAYS